MKQIKPKADVLIEVSYEIVAKLGGIHTVIKTKAPFMKDYYKDNYIVIGIYTKKDARKKFKRKEPNKELKNLFQKLKKEKINCHYGIWKAKSSPKAILIDISKLKRDRATKNEIYKDYWIDLSPRRLSKPKLYSDALIWSFATGKLLSEMVKLRQFKKKKVVVNIHEYMSGLTLLYLRKHKTNIPIVFTTHATVLGRAVTFGGVNLPKDMIIYKKKDKAQYKKVIDSYRYRVGQIIYDRHLYEKACAKKADVFTTVSETLSKEAAFVLDKPADIITPNGLDMVTPPSIEEQLAINYRAKKKVSKFLESYFHKFYQIKTDNSIFFYTAGRYEIITKGYDLLIESLGKLNLRLKKERCKNQVFVFLFIMTQKKRKVTDEVLEIVNSKSTKLTAKNPPNCLFKGKHDMIHFLLEKNKLLNRRCDKVKVLYYPAPVKRKDKLLSMHYKEAISAMDLGIFPSLYEPWGYTPLETAAMGTLAITTDIAGFGKFIQKRTDQRGTKGIAVLTTKAQTKDQMAQRLSNMMHEIVSMPKERRLEKRIEANKLSEVANWDDFSKEYIKAHNLAIEKHKSNKREKR